MKHFEHSEIWKIVTLAVFLHFEDLVYFGRIVYALVWPTVLSIFAHINVISNKTEEGEELMSASSLSSP